MLNARANVRQAKLTLKFMALYLKFGATLLFRCTTWSISALAECK